MSKKRTLIWLLIVCSILFSSCGVDDIDISNYENEGITFTGLTENDEFLTIKNLKDLKCITKETQSTSDKIGTVKATGPLLSTVVESYGLSLADYSKIIIYGDDDYDIELDKKFIAENQIILAFGTDGEPLRSDSAPVRVIIPESDSAYWVRMVSKVEFIK